MLPDLGRLVLCPTGATEFDERIAEINKNYEAAKKRIDILQREADIILDRHRHEQSQRLEDASDDLENDEHSEGNALELRKKELHDKTVALERTMVKANKMRESAEACAEERVALQRKLEELKVATGDNKLKTLLAYSIAQKRLADLNQMVAQAEASVANMFALSTNADELVDKLLAENP